MRRFFKLTMALALVAVMAAPALAEVKLGGYYRAQGTAWDFTGDENTSSFIDQRIRLMLTNTLNDYVSVVYFGEVDAPFGEPSKGGIGGGGQISADGVNVETKNMYVDLKVPNTTWAVRTGIQGWGTGNEFETLVVSDDMAAINARGTVGPATLDFIYSKWNEGTQLGSSVARDWDDANANDEIDAGEVTDVRNTVVDRASWDDYDFYGAKAAIKPSEQLSLTGLALFQDNNAIDAERYFLGVSGDYRFANYGIKSFFLYGDSDSDTLDGNSWVFDIAGFVKIADGNDMKVHFAYFPDDVEAAMFNSQGAFEYNSDNLMIFLTDVFYNNGPAGRIALTEAAYEGNGLMLATVSGNMALPQAYYLKYGAGYFSAVEDEGREGKSLGFEGAAMVGKKFADIYDLSLRGGYALLGDYFDDPTGDDPDDFWKVVAMLNVAF